MPEIKIYRSKRLEIIRRAGALLVMVFAAALWLIGKPGYLEWILLIVSAAAFIYIFFFSKKEKLLFTMDEKGIWANNPKRDGIEWDQIKEVDFKNISFIEYLVFTPKESYEPHELLSTRGGLFWYGENTEKLTLNLSQVGIKPEILESFVKKMIQSDENDRKNLLMSWNEKEEIFSLNQLTKGIIFMLLSLTLAFSISYNLGYELLLVVFMLFLVLVFFANMGTEGNPKIRRKLNQLTQIIGIAILISSFGESIIDKATDTLADKIELAVDEYKTQNNHYPKDLKSFKNHPEFNFYEKYLLDRTELYTYENDFNFYELIINLFGEKSKAYVIRH